MGNSYSEPIEGDPGLNHVGICLTQPNTILLINAPDAVEHMTLRVVKEADAAAQYHQEVKPKYEYGLTRIKLKAWCFALGAGKVDATYGKLFCVRILGEMYKMGYDLVASADLARTKDHSTLFFAKNSTERPGSKMVCLAPGKTDTLVLLFADDLFIDTTRTAISETWLKGIQNEQMAMACGQSLFEFKLHGSPWLDYAGADNVHCRQMLINIIGKLGAIHYKLMGGVNIKGGTDSLFFMYDPNYSMTPSGFSMISLNKTDRLRLVNCVELSGSIRDTLTTNFQPPQREEDKYGSWEFKLKGRPWNCSGDEAIKSRRLISRISETLLQNGWALTNALDISRSINDKSALLYTRASPFKTTFACIAPMDRNKICLIDFPPNETMEFKAIIERKYLPGIKNEQQRDENCIEIKLNEQPWIGSNYGSSGAHARIMLMYISNMASYMGWRLISSADVSARYVTQDNGPDYPLDVHTWYFVYLPWTKAGDGFAMPEAPTTMSSGDGLDPSFAPPSYNDAVQNY